ncbi:MAG TPA: trigger factor [Longimicrobiaceae bacterium]|jgi:trigger factor|nr:trigger factor [Longimicrobiaceae bacterium]
MAAETTDLRIDVQEPASWSRRLSITVPRERVQRVRRSVASQLAGNVRLPGFRKGKMPANLLEKQFGPQIEQETLDRVIQEAYKEALDSGEFQPITQGQVGNVQYAAEADLTFDVEFEVHPPVEIKTLAGFSATRPAADAGEADVDAVLERLRGERGHWHDAPEGTKPDFGDQVTVEIRDRDAAEDAEEPRPYRFVLGEGQAISDVEEAIRTLAAGGEADFDVRFPEDFPDEEQRGQEQHLHIRLIDVQNRHLPELDDEFATSLGEFGTMAALRERVLADLKDDATRRASDEVRGQLMQQVVEANPFEVPNSMVDRYLDYMLGEGTEQAKRRKRTAEQEEQFSQYRRLMRPQAEASLKRMMVVEHLADAQGLRATQDEIDARVDEIAEKGGRTPTEVWLELEKSGQLQVLENEITEDKVFTFLQSQNTVA